MTSRKVLAWAVARSSYNNLEEPLLAWELNRCRKNLHDRYKIRSGMNLEIDSAPKQQGQRDSYTPSLDEAWKILANWWYWLKNGISYPNSARHTRKEERPVSQNWPTVTTPEKHHISFRLSCPHKGGSLHAHIWIGIQRSGPSWSTNISTGSSIQWHKDSLVSRPSVMVTLRSKMLLGTRRSLD